MVTAPRKALCPEDDDFMAALDRMVAENIHEAYTRGKEVSKPPSVDIAIPWQVKASLKRPGAQRVSLKMQKSVVVHLLLATLQMDRIRII